MSRTLNLVDCLLTSGRNLQTLGHTHKALDLFRRLAAFRELTREVAEEVQSRLADLYLAADDFKQARRHLAAALTFRPQHAEYYHRMALLIEADPDAAIDRARLYHRQAVRCEADNANYWLDYGVHLLTFGREDLGRKALRRAFRLGVGDPNLVGEIADALRQAGYWRDARRLVLRALFRSPKDRRFRALWERQQFEELRRQQQTRRPDGTPRPQSGPMTLPFVRIEDERAPRSVDGKIIRLDRGAPNVPKPTRLPRSRRNRRTN